MDNHDSDKNFAGSIPEFYDTYLVPLMFEPFADDLAGRLGARPVQRVLELAAGTGAVTRAMAAALPDWASIVATDLNQEMLDRAPACPAGCSVSWRQADAMELPFEDESFDAVVCQFGVMFFPDRAKAFAETYRVLKPGGLFLFNTWDRIETNDFAAIATEALGRLFPDDPPRFFERTPYGYHDFEVMQRDLAAGGFTKPVVIETVTMWGRAATSEMAAKAICQGTPLRSEIEARDASGLERATAFLAGAIADRLGRENVVGKIQAVVVAVGK